MNLSVDTSHVYQHPSPQLLPVQMVFSKDNKSSCSYEKYITRYLPLQIMILYTIELTTWLLGITISIWVTTV